jgi:hypothetical protein
MRGSGLSGRCSPAVESVESTFESFHLREECKTYDRPHHKVPRKVLRILVCGGRVEGLDIVAGH